MKIAINGVTLSGSETNRCHTVLDMATIMFRPVGPKTVEETGETYDLTNIRFSDTIGAADRFKASGLQKDATMAVIHSKSVNFLATMRDISPQSIDFA